MSYNYDANPWDDDPNNSAQQPTPATNQYTTGGGGAGYTNPVNQYYFDNNQSQQTNPTTQYGGAWNDDPYSTAQQATIQQPTYQQYDQEQAPIAGSYGEAPSDFVASQQQQQQQQQGQQKKQPSAFRRFIGAHIPFCGSLMDTCCSINLPFIDALVQHVNKDLLVSKMFYFFFYSAFGSLFPLMGVYFKQLGMNPAQVGILTGVRPFIEIFSAPFWNSLAERFNKRKALLIFSIISWIVFTYSLAHIRPPASACIAFNDTDYELYIPYSGNALANPDVSQFTEEQQQRGFELANEASGSSSSVASSKTSPEEESKAGVLVDEETESTQRRRRRRRKRSPILRRRESSNDDDSGIETSANEEEEDEEPSSEAERRRGGNSEEAEEEQEQRELNSKVKRPSNDQENDDEEEERDELASERRTGSKRKGETEESEADEEKSSTGEEDEETEPEDKKGKPPPAVSNSRLQQIAKQAASTTSSSLAGSTTSTTTETISTHTITGAPKRKFKDRHRTPPTHIVGMSPITVEYAAGYNKTKHSQFVTPMFSTVVYKLDDIRSVFFLLLLLISLGEFFSAPAITLADSCTLRYLGDQVDLYCRQRMFGSLSWAVTLLLVGMALDNATSIADHPCGPHLRERSYTVCYMIFSLLMGCALMTATQFRFDDDQNEFIDDMKKRKQLADEAAAMEANDAATTKLANQPSANIIYNPAAAFDDPIPEDDPYASTQPRSIFNTAPPVNEPPPGSGLAGSGKEKFEFLDKWKSAVFAQRTRELPQWVNVFRQFSHNPFHLTYLFITWFLGCGVGLVFTFLFWHLQDVGGTPTLFGICSVINHISEILAYFFSFSFIKRFGHTKVLSVGLGCNAIRFVYVAFLTNPYYALPFELVQGITHAACFAACCSYMSHKSSPELKTSTQGVMQGLHHGIGRACGTLLGGFLINAIGSRASFALYGLLSGLVLAGFLHVRKKASAEELEIKVDDSDALGGYGAPQGVPGAKPTKLI